MYFSSRKEVRGVSANLCRAFFHKVERNLVQSITCQYFGVVGHSTHLVGNQRYQRNAVDTDRPEGGVDLECQYLFNVEHQNFESEIIYMDNFYPPLDFCTWRKFTVARPSVEKEKTCARESSPAN